WEAYDNAWPKKHFHRYLKADNGQGYFVSLCHGWSTGVTNWLTEYVLGIQTRSGGFTKATIVPHLGYLHWASGRVPTPRGNIVLRVARHGGAESLNLTLPPGVKTLVGVVGRTVTVNGVAVAPVRRRSKHCYVNLIKSGAYHIVGTP
ncbi:MAG: alpha-L-rhamnosidase C-terminal domain-containing protein, partial [Phycisphaerae bacterium]